MHEGQPNEVPLPHEHELTLTERELFERLGWFTHIRWFMAAATLGLVLVSWFVLAVRFRAPDGEPTMMPAVYITAMIFLYNAVFTFLVHLVRSRGRITRRTIVLLALGQIACDMIAVTVLVHDTGGVENYFIILVLLPMVIASELLPQHLAYAAAGGASLLIQALAWGEQRGLLPHVHADWPGNRLSQLYKDPIYVLQVTSALTAMSFAMVFIASAIAKRLRLRERELEDAYRRLSHADEAKSFFMRKAGHEMRAPLAAIFSILDGILADLGPAAEEEHRRLLQRAKRRTRALMELVSDLRRYSRLRSAPTEEMKREPLQLHELAANTIDLFRKQADKGGLELRCQAEPAAVEGDEEMVRQLITNLVANAIQYTPAGGKVDATVSTNGRWAVLEVADTGIGLGEKAQGRLFEEFYRSPEAKKVFADGTGLGLAICKRIVDLHDGQIEAASRDGGGSVFTVRLPLAGE